MFVKDSGLLNVMFIKKSGLLNVMFIKDSGLLNAMFIKDSGLLNVIFIKDSGLFRVLLRHVSLSLYNQCLNTTLLYHIEVCGRGVVSVIIFGFITNQYCYLFTSNTNSDFCVQIGFLNVLQTLNYIAFLV